MKLSIVMVLAIGCSGGETLDEDASPLEAAHPPTITSVATSDGFTQIRQNALVQIVIKGKKLAGTTAVTIGSLPATIDSVSQHTVRATLFTGAAQALGPLDVTVVAKRGTVTLTATRRAALTFTPFVVSPTVVSGNGTFASPINLCDPQLENTGGGSTVVLLPGTHQCDRVITIGPNTLVEGAADGSTILQGKSTGGFGVAICCGGDGPAPTPFRTLTFAPPLATFSIDSFGNKIAVDHVVDAGGINAFEAAANIDHYDYVGPGTAIDISGGQITNATVRQCGPGPGIQLSGDSSTLIDNIRVEDCGIGVVVGLPAPPFFAVSVDIRNSVFLHDQVGVRIEDGRTTLTNVAISDGTTGIAMANGRLNIAGAQITGHDTGIAAATQSNPGGQDRAIHIVASGLTVAGGRFGITFGGLDNSLSLDHSVLRDQTQAALRVSANDSVINLGDALAPGHNELSVVSGFAIDDQRFETGFFFRYITAVGTTLNGASFDGQTIDGPATLEPFYRIRDFDSGIQF